MKRRTFLGTALAALATQTPKSKFLSAVNKFDILVSKERRTPAEIDMALFAY